MFSCIMPIILKTAILLFELCGDWLGWPRGYALMALLFSALWIVSVLSIHLG